MIQNYHLATTVMHAEAAVELIHSQEAATDREVVAYQNPETVKL